MGHGLRTSQSFQGVLGTRSLAPKKPDVRSAADCWPDSPFRRIRLRPSAFSFFVC